MRPASRGSGHRPSGENQPHESKCWTPFSPSGPRCRGLVRAGTRPPAGSAPTPTRGPPWPATCGRDAEIELPGVEAEREVAQPRGERGAAAARRAAWSSCPAGRDCGRCRTTRSGRSRSKRTPADASCRRRRRRRRRAAERRRPSVRECDLCTPSSRTSSGCPPCSNRSFDRERAARQRPRLRFGRLDAGDEGVPAGHRSRAHHRHGLDLDFRTRIVQRG